MTAKLAHFLNKTILVSLPALFGDEEPRLCTLIGIEPYGLWLQSEELIKDLRLADQAPPGLTTVTAFFPFTQIAYVLGETQFATVAQNTAAPAPAETKAPPAAQEKDSGEQYKGGAKKQPIFKNPKIKR